MAGPALYRREDLIKLTKPNDTPWDWEFFGSYRVKAYGKDVYFWENQFNPIFSLDIIHGGAIHRGKWVGYKMRELQEQYGYKLDYGNREVVEDWLKSDPNEDVPPKYKRIPSIIKNRTRPIFEIIYGKRLAKNL